MPRPDGDRRRRHHDLHRPARPHRPRRRRLLIDWRSPAAEPFFAATLAAPARACAAGAATAGRSGRITDYWDEVFDLGGLHGHAALDDESAFIASLGASRSPRMRDVLGTIAADQDAIIRAGSRGALVVDGGPGTGKTVVALHRTAYLLYSDPRLGASTRPTGRGAVRRAAPALPHLRCRRAAQPRRGRRRDRDGRRPGARGRGARGPSPTPRSPGSRRAPRWSARSSRRCGSTRSRRPSRSSSRATGARRCSRAADWADAFGARRPGHAAQRRARPGLGRAADDPGREAPPR